MKAMKVTFWRDWARIFTVLIAVLTIVGVCLCTTSKPANAVWQNGADAPLKEYLSGTDQEMYEQFLRRCQSNGNGHAKYGRYQMVLTQDWVIPAALTINCRNNNEKGYIELDLNGHTVTNQYTLRLSMANFILTDTAASRGKWVNTGTGAYFDYDSYSSFDIYGATVCTDQDYLVHSPDQIGFGGVTALLTLVGGRIIVPEGGTAIRPSNYEGTILDLDATSFLNYDGEVLYGDYEEVLAELAKPTTPDTPETPVEPTEPEQPDAPETPGDGDNDNDHNDNNGDEDDTPTTPDNNLPDNMVADAPNNVNNTVGIALLSTAGGSVVIFAVGSVIAAVRRRR